MAGRTPLSLIATPHPALGAEVAYRGIQLDRLVRLSVAGIAARLAAPRTPEWRMTMHPMPKSSPELSQLDACRDRYQAEWSWSVSVDVENQRLIVPVGAELDAVTMPASLGEKVHQELLIAMLAGPVLRDPSGRWWTFLVKPNLKVRSELLAELRRLKVYPTPTGAHVILPNAVDGTDGMWRWIQQPQQHRPLCPGSVVIGLARRIAATQLPQTTYTSDTRLNPAG
jgi:hypothetical protein